MKKRLLSFVVFSMVLGLAGCNSKGGGETDQSAAPDKAADTSAIYFNGSSTLTPVINTIAASFNEEYETWDKVDSSFEEAPISIYVASGGSGQGVATLIDGTTSFGMVAREVKDEEKKKIKDEKEYLVGIDALAITVNKESPLLEKTDDLTTDQVIKIFSGEYKTWQEVDSSLPADDIVVLTRDVSGGAHEVFQKNIMKDVDVSADVIQAPTMGGLVEKIIDNKNAIGYASYGVASQNEDKLVKLKLDGVACTEENITGGNYILQRPLLLVGSGEPTEQQQAFLDVVLGEEGQAVVEEQGFIRSQSSK